MRNPVGKANGKKQKANGKKQKQKQTASFWAGLLQLSQISQLLIDQVDCEMLIDRYLCRMFIGLIAVTMVALCSTGTADTPAATADSAFSVDDSQVMHIARQLMAPCCWSGTVDGHQSPAADEVKAHIRQALQQGFAEKQILDAFVAAYGERILAKPRATGFNLTAWIIPAVALMLGTVVVWQYLRRSSRTKEFAASQQRVSLDARYSQRLEQELDEFDR